MTTNSHDAGQPPESAKSYIREMLSELAAMAEQVGDPLLAERIRNVALCSAPRTVSRQLSKAAE